MGRCLFSTSVNVMSRSAISSQLSKDRRRLFASGSVRRRRRLLKMGNRAVYVANCGQSCSQGQMCADGSRPDAEGLAIVENRFLRPVAGHQQGTEEFVGISEIGIDTQGCFQLAPRFIRVAGSAKQHRVVVVRYGVAGAEA